MAVQVAYKIKIGRQLASSQQRESNLQLLALKTELSMDDVGGRCEVSLVGGEGTPIAGKIGDEVTVELDAGNGAKRVFTGEVESLQTDANTQRIIASDGLVKLARMDIEAGFEQVNVDFIVKQLLDDAGLTAGEVEKGPQLAAYTLHRGPRALQHMRNLARLCGVDLFTDGEGHAHFVAEKESSKEYRLKYGESILTLDLKSEPPLFDGIAVQGEGAASSKGAEKFHWLPSDLTGVSATAALSEKGQAKPNAKVKRALQFSSGAVRSGEAATYVAEQHMKAIAARQIRGRIKIFAKPGIEPGDHISIDALPDNHVATELLQKNNRLRVRCVRHELDRTRGFITHMVV
ncbi:hypothetical protein ACFL2V_00090 [Pseudomonadota bacterium]